jgi:hypothetical protein
MHGHSLTATVLPRMYVGLIVTASVEISEWPCLSYAPDQSGRLGSPAGDGQVSGSDALISAGER